ncbi:MAG: hypothetical protein HEQ29_23330 [Dolichospermum sp. LBC05a]|nr:hypothetical protein [Dolichospermum sp. OL01]MCO5799540.1 hypothetical protein [Dolichospermum sp. OL03]MCS6279370.1 hypothetical protein [Dolichospermum sp.]QSV60878.1 MAG: hypothetical protein HEQ29_23330 [Dolichospermum sp. LBC05a]
MRIGGKRSENSEKKPPRISTMEEVNAQVDNDIKEFLANLEYWNYLPKLNVMRHKKHNYDVDFDQIIDDSSLCNWIMHIYNKPWMEEPAVLEFLDFASIYRDSYERNYQSENVKKYLSNDDEL